MLWNQLILKTGKEKKKTNIMSFLYRLFQENRIVDKGKFLKKYSR